MTSRMAPSWFDWKDERWMGGEREAQCFSREVWRVERVVWP